MLSLKSVRGKNQILDEVVIRIQFGLKTWFVFVAFSAVICAFVVFSSHREANINRGVEFVSKMDGDTNANPINLIRAINHLRSLGHQGAIDCLSRVDKQEHLRKSIDIAVALLYQPKHSNEGLPTFDPSTPMGFKLELDDWQISVEVHNGIPFHVDWMYTSYTGFWTSRDFLLNWAASYSEIKRSDLTPTDDPFSTAAELIILLKNRALTEYPLLPDEDRLEIAVLVTDRIRTQVFKMVEHLFPEFESLAESDWILNDQCWDAVVLECKNRGLKWDRQKMQYSFTK